MHSLVLYSLFLASIKKSFKRIANFEEARILTY